MIPKFRAWDKESKSMHQILEIIYSNDLSYISFITIGGGNLIYGPKRRLGDDVIIMQSTGLKDKNGVEIFEGDVLLHTSSSVNYSDTYWHSYVQAYRMGNGAFRIKGKHIYDTDLMGARSRIEVVGNIYQHQKLLEKEYFSTSDGVVVQANEN